jgi:glycosyltransferase involved in cell wall biosynthesis
MNPMRVLITAPDLNKQGGVSSYFATLAEYFSVPVDFFAIGSRGNEEHISGTPIRMMRDICNFYRKLRIGGHDIVHLNPSLASGAVLRDGVSLLIAKRMNKKVLVFFHGWCKDFEGRLRGLRLKTFKSIYFKADAIIVLANEFSDQFRSWGYSGPIHVETTLVGDNEIEEIQFTEVPRHKDENINLLFLARIEKAKGIYEAIETFRLLKTKCRMPRLTVAGEGTELDALKEYVRHNKLEGIDFLGYVQGNNKSNALRNASIYVLPTHGEGMPKSVLEAMAFGLPVVTRAVGGLKDFFEDGKMGFITESEDPAVFSDLIMKLIDNPELRIKIGRYNQEYVRDRLTASKVVKRIEHIYREVACKK